MATPALTAVPAEPSFLSTRRGKLTLFFLCMVGFLDFVDASIVNVALPSIRRELHFSLPSLQRHRRDVHLTPLRWPGNGTTSEVCGGRRAAERHACGARGPVDQSERAREGSRDD